MARCRCARNTADFKSKVALEALREQQPIHEIAKRYQVHASQVTEWKKALQGNASSVFESTSAKHDEALKQKRKEDRHLKQIGQLKVEVDFLKDSCDKLGVVIPEDELRRARSQDEYQQTVQTAGRATFKLLP